MAEWGQKVGGTMTPQEGIRTLSDAELVQRVKNIAEMARFEWDKAALRELVRRYQGPLIPNGKAVT